MSRYDVPQILEELDRSRQQRDDLSDAEVRELLERGVLDPRQSNEQGDGPGTGSHALRLLLGAAGTAAVVHALTSLPRGVKP